MIRIFSKNLVYPNKQVVLTRLIKLYNLFVLCYTCTNASQCRSPITLIYTQHDIKIQIVMLSSSDPILEVHF